MARLETLALAPPEAVRVDVEQVEEWVRTSYTLVAPTVLARRVLGGG